MKVLQSHYGITQNHCKNHIKVIVRVEKVIVKLYILRAKNLNMRTKSHSRTHRIIVKAKCHWESQSHYKVHKSFQGHIISYESTQDDYKGA